MKNISIILLLISLGSAVTNGFPTEPSNHENELNGDRSLQKVEDISDDTRQLLIKAKVLRKFKNIVEHPPQNSHDEDVGSVEDYITCAACNTGVVLIQMLIGLKQTDEQIKNTITWFCSSFNVESGAVCNGLSNLFGLEIIYILKHVNLGPGQICGFIMDDVCSDDYSPYHDWTVKFPPIPKPTPRDMPLPISKAPRLKILHLSDSHYDPDYLEGANAKCKDPLCCRASSGHPQNPNDAAGKWGDYRNCDTPKRTLENLLEHIVKTHPDIDYIYWTGDIPPHDVWNQTKQNNLNIIRETTRLLSNTFPGIPIFPALGNHESSPVNTFPPHYLDRVNISMSWLYDELDILWGLWLPFNVSQTVRRGAFYSILLKPDFRIISLNMNYCSNKNWWLLLNSTDPDAELQWLIDELQKAEIAQEKVHILGHIAPGNSDCLKVWSRNFYKIVGRYESTITAQFYGHTHYDELEIFYDPENLTRPISVGYIGPSVTPFVNLNPGYRIYYIDGDHNKTTRTVLDHESWIMNLKQANTDDNPIWYKLYSAKSAYDMEGLRPSDWNKLISEMANSTKLFDLYYKHYWKDSSLRPACDAACRMKYLCDIKSGRSHDRTRLCSGGKLKDNKKHLRPWARWAFNGIKSLWKSLEYIEQEVLIATNEVNPWG